jgi:hypothetical protein
MKKTVVIYLTFTFMLMPFTGCGKVMNKLGNVKTADVVPIVNMKEGIRWREYVIGAGIGLVLALVSREGFHYLRSSLPPPHTYTPSIVQQFENILTTFDTALNMFVPSEIRTRVYSINSQVAAAYSNEGITEDTLSGLLNLFGSTYSILVDSGGYAELQRFCLNSFENLRAVINTNEFLSTEARNRLRDLSNNIAQANRMNLQNQWM